MVYGLFAKTFFRSLFLTLLVLSLVSLSSAQVRTSTNYQLQSDSINFGGGLSSSTNYVSESTFGEVGTGRSSSATYRLRAGYQQMHEAYLAITGASNVALSPSIGGLSGGIANGSTSVNILTDSPSGYQLSIEASNAPAMQKGADVIDDYVSIADPNPDFSFVTGASDAHLGFSPEGPDIVSLFRDNGSSCGVSTSDASLSCWLGLSTTTRVIASGATNHPTGATTTVNFRVGIGGSAGVPAGTYVATTTLTAITL